MSETIEVPVELLKQVISYLEDSNLKRQIERLTDTDPGLYPEHAKQRFVLHRAHAAQDFMEWAGTTRGLRFGRWDDHENFRPAYAPLPELLSAWLGINLQRISEEKTEMVKAMSEQHEKAQ